MAKEIAENPVALRIPSPAKERKSSFLNKFTSMLDIIWGKDIEPREPTKIEGEKPLSELPADIKADIKRQQEGKLPSASPAFEESATKVIGRQLDVGQKESIRKQLGATSFEGVETAANIDKKIIKVGKYLLADSSLKDILGQKIITSLRRTKENKTVKYNPDSGHSHGVAIDFRANWKFGEEDKVLTGKFKPSLEEDGWTVVPSKAGKETVKETDQTWMKLTNKKGEFLFVELEQNPPHLHIHLGEDRREPEGKW